jgi:hypothetical protein
MLGANFILNILHFQDETFIFSTISEGENNPSAKSALFLALQIAQRDACQIKTKPLRILVFRAEAFKTSKRIVKDGGESQSPLQAT